MHRRYGNEREGRVWKEWCGGEERRGGGQWCKAKETGQQPAVFYKLPFKRNQQRNRGAREGSSGPGAGLRRDVLTSPALHHSCVGERTNKQNQFRHRRGFKQMWRVGNIEGSGVNQHFLVNQLCLAVYLETQPVCAQEKTKNNIATKRQKIGRN